MKNFVSMFPRSAKEFRDVRSLCITGIFIAISMVIENFSLNLPFVRARGSVPWCLGPNRGPGDQGPRLGTTAPQVPCGHIPPRPPSLPV